MKRFINHTKQSFLLRLNRILQVLVAAIIIVLITPTKSSFRYEFTQGHYWKHETLEAPFDFAIQKTESEIAEQKNEIIATKSLYFDYNEQTNINMEKELEKSIASFSDKNNLSITEQKLLENGMKDANH